MTDEGPGAEQTPPAEEQSPMSEAKSMLGDVADFSTGEGMVAFAGIAILALWLIFDVFLDEYGYGYVELFAATAAVLVPRLNPDSVTKFAPVGAIMKLIGYVFGITLLFEVIYEIETGFYDEALTIIAALLTFAAWAVGFLGARSIKT